MTPLHRTRRAIIATAASAVLLTAACGADSEDPAPTPTSAATDDGGSAEASGDYADGTYDAQGSYPNPGGTSSVTVELTLEDGTVTDVTVTPEASGTSRQYQEKFVGGIAEEVVGKRLDELDVDKVAGSSLTAGGFNRALDEIKADASA